MRTGNRGSRKLLLPNSNREVASVKTGLAFDDSFAFKESEDFIEHLLPHFFVGHFAAAEDNHDFDVIAVLEKAADFADFDVKVVVADFEAKFHLLELGLFFASFFAVFGFFFHLLVLVFTPIDDFDDRRVGVCGNFHEVNTCVSGEKLGTSARHDAKLLSIRSNYANFRVADFSVNSGTCVFTNGGDPFFVNLIVPLYQENTKKARGGESQRFRKLRASVRWGRSMTSESSRSAMV